MVKLDFMKRQQSSCHICNILFLKPDSDSLIVKQTATFIGEDGDRYISGEQGDVKVLDVISSCPEELELFVLEFDHLPEEEQRALRLLLPSEKFVPKADRIAKYRSEQGMRLEASKCQLVCVKCHLLETIRREKGGRRGEVTKTKYVKSLKLAGCSSCGYLDSNLPRFFDMDHIDPANKIADLATMVNTKDYSLEDVIAECKKCRVLCKFCHKIHTKLQIAKGII